MPVPPPASPWQSPSPLPGGAATATAPSNEGTARRSRKLDIERPFSPSGMSVADTHLPLAPLRRRERLELDPLAGEDELWTEEDFLRATDDEDYVAFLRTLWLAVLACTVFWIVVAFGAVQVLGLGSS